jgi:hypothetical protein
MAMGAKLSRLEVGVAEVANENFGGLTVFNRGSRQKRKENIC